MLTLGVLVSCSTYMNINGYSEMDGAYYDSNKDTIPRYELGTAGDNNYVGGYYSYRNEEDLVCYRKDNDNIVKQGQSNQQKQKKKYQYWGNNKTDSDWGDYTGRQTYYINNIYYGGWGYYPYYSWRYWRFPDIYGELGWWWGGPLYSWGYHPSWIWNIGMGFGSYYYPWGSRYHYIPRYKSRNVDYIDRSNNYFRNIRNNNGGFRNSNIRNNGSSVSSSKEGFIDSDFKKSEDYMPKKQLRWNNDRFFDSGFGGGFSRGLRNGAGFRSGVRR